MEIKHFVKNFSDLLPTENNSPFKRIFTVGDIHGSFSKLLSIWEQIKVTDDDLVVFLGCSALLKEIQLKFQDEL